MGSGKGSQAVEAATDLVASYGLEPEALLRMYELMWLSRKLDRRGLILNRQGRVPFHVSGEGQEGCQVGAAMALRPGVDYVFPYYRDLAVVLTLGLTPREYMLLLFGKAGDPSGGGRQMPGHYGHRGLNIITASSPVGTQIPHAAGVALASRMKGEDAVTWVSFGEGTTSKGDFHEGLNFAGIYRLPVVFFCENNMYAISVHQTKQMAIENVADRAAGYGFPGIVVDGNDPLEVYRVTREAVERARRGEGPTLIEAKTYRFVPHTSDDDDRVYRSREEVEAWRQRDPVIIFERRLMEAGILDEATRDAIQQRVDEAVEDAVDYAEKAPDPPLSDLTTHVYAEPEPGAQGAV